MEKRLLKGFILVGACVLYLLITSFSAHATLITYDIVAYSYFLPQEDAYKISGKIVIDDQFQVLYQEPGPLGPGEYTWGHWLVQSVSLYSDFFTFEGAGYLDLSVDDYGYGVAYRLNEARLTGTGTSGSYSGNLNTLYYALNSTFFLDQNGNDIYEHGGTLLMLPDMLWAYEMQFYDDFGSRMEMIYFTAKIDPPVPTPEPSTIMLISSGLIGTGIFFRKKRL